jgi:hypothetical protein
VFSLKGYWVLEATRVCWLEAFRIVAILARLAKVRLSRGLVTSGALKDQV